MVLSFQESYKIQAVRLQFEIYSLGERLEDVKLLCEYEQNNVENVKREVTCLRKRISDLKSVTYQLDKGCPIPSSDTRPQKSSRSSSSSSELTGLDLMDTSWLAQQYATQLLD